MKNKAKRKLIGNSVKIIISVAVILAIAITTRQINKLNIKNREIAKAEGETIVEQLTEIPEGYIGITTAEELRNMSNNLAENYILMADIDMTGESWTPVGTSENSAFTGILDGNLYTISNLNIESTSQYIGMFGYTNNATIKNLTLEDVNVKSTYKNNTVTNGNPGYIGGLVGYNNSGTINNVHVTNTDTTENIIGNTTEINSTYIGGLVGYNTGTITNISNNEKIETISTTGNIWVGGIIGYTTGTIANSSNKGNIEATSTTGAVYTGGLISSTSSTGAISNSYSKSNIVINSDYAGSIYIGGLVGTSNSNIQKSYSTGTIQVENSNGNPHIGGLIGNRPLTNAIVSNVYSTVNIIGNTKGGNVGGLIGYLYNPQNLSNSYAVGKIEIVGESLNKGGIIGNVGTNYAGYPTNSYWSPETTGVLTSAGLGTQAKNFQLMLKQSIYNTWDFDTIWKIEEGKTLPYLKELEKPEEVNKENYTYTEYEGQGTTDDPYLIKTAEQLQGIKNNLNEIYKIANNIELDPNKNFEPIGNNTTPFTGTLDGSGFTITGLKIESDSQYVGMFGYIQNATIKNLTLENVNVKSTYSNTANNTSTYAYIGGVIAYSNTNTTIENIKVIGNSTIENEAEVNSVYVGGIIGYQNNVNAVITNLINKADIIQSSTTGTIYAGGIIGYNSGFISNSVNKGNITITTQSGNICVGGIVAQAIRLEGGILVGSCYNTGNITTTSNENINQMTTIGGIVGYSKAKEKPTYSSQNKNAIFQDIYSTGDIIATAKEGRIYAGGIIGEAYSYRSDYFSSAPHYYYNRVMITNAYATGKIDAQGNQNYISGIASSINELYGTLITNSYWSPETTNQEYDSSTSAKARLFESMLHENTYNGWNFASIWGIDEGTSLPYLKQLEKPEEINKTNYTYMEYEGRGTQEEPYLIKTAEQLQGIKNQLDTVYYKLANDIEWDSTKDFIPIGNSITPFKASLDGNGHKITGLKIDSNEQYVGMFGNIQEGSIKNLTLENITVNSKYTYTLNNKATYIGGVAGYLLKGTIENVYVKGISTIQQNSEGSQVTHIGGLVGQLYNSAQINKVGSMANINSNTNGIINAGGLVGSAISTVTINNSYATGNVETTTLSSDTYIGGLIGTIDGTTINNSYAVGNVTATSETGNIGNGALIGKSNYTNIIVNTYATGKIKSETTGTKGEGGLIALGNTVTTTNSYWTPETTGQIKSPASSVATPKYVQEMLKETTFTEWDFEEIWQIDEGTSMPYLKGMEKPEAVNVDLSSYLQYEGEGTQENPYLISTVEQLEGIRLLLADSVYYKLTNDIQWDNTKNFEPIGNDSISFKGTLDGDNHKIINLKIEADALYIGMFAHIYEGTIKNLILEDINIKVDTGYAAQIGAITGRNEGNIENVKVIGTSKIENNSTYATTIGGIVGNNRGNIINTSSAVNINAIYTSTTSYGSNIGGLIGENYEGTIDKSYSTGNINIEALGTNTYVGGLIGQNYRGTVGKSYSTGNIDVISETGQIRSGGLIGNTDNGTIINVYSISKVTSTSTSGMVYGGGLLGTQAGSNRPSITNAYAIGKVIIDTTGTKYSGGLIGSGTAIVTNSYYSEKSTGQENSSGGTAKTIQELLYEDAYETWDFEDIWKIEPEGGSLAYLKELDMPKGILEDDVIYETKIPVYKTDNKGNPLEGAKFTVKNSEGEIVREGVSKKGGRYIIGDLEAGVYTLTEIEAPVSYIKDPKEYRFYFAEDAKIYDISTEQEIEKLTIQNTALQIDINKIDSQTKQGIKGATIGLFDLEGNAIIGIDGNEVKAISNEEGIASLTKMPAGTYKYKEVEPARGYKLNNTEYTVTITEDGTVTFGEENQGTIENEKIYLDATITKKALDTEELLEGATIGLYNENRVAITDEEGNPILKETNEDGQVTFEHLEVGTYYYKEITAPKGYELNNNMYAFSVNQNETITYGTNEGVLYNTLKTGTITIIKKAIITELRLEGAVFGLYDLEGNKIYDESGRELRGTTNKQGILTFTNLKPGTYVFKELKAPVGYKLNDFEQRATINDDYTVTYLVHNGTFYNNPKTNYTVGITLPSRYPTGTGITIRHPSGTTSSGTTNSSGGVNFTGLSSGNYTYKIDGDNTEYTFTINPDGTVTGGSGGTSSGITYTGGSITKDVIVKSRPATEGQKIYLYGESGNPIYGEDGNHRYITTDESGKGTFTGLDSGTYKYKEENSDELYSFTIGDDGSITYRDKDGNIIVDVTIGSNVIGSGIGLYDGSGNPITGTDGNPIIKYIGGSGHVIFEDLTPGRYQYKQTEVPDGYIPNENTYGFTVNEDGSVTFDDGGDGTIHNKEAINITARKIWVDNEVQKVHRPEKIKIQVLNGVEVIQEKEISNTETEVTFNNLVKYNEDGSEITYTIKEVEVNTNDLKFYTSTINGLTITNTFTVPSETKEINVNKVWVDTEAQRVHRPESVTIVAKRGEEKVGQVELTVANALEETTNTWQGQITNLPKYDSNGNEIEYTLEELNVNKFYISTVNGLNITNTFTVPNETKTITVNKVWVDTEAQRVHRPESVTIVAKRGEEVVGQVQLTVANALEETTNTWQGQITNLPKYDENGNKIEYTLEELNVNKFYTSTVNGLNITNTFTVPSETKELTVNKVWVDTEAQQAHRPESVTIVVKRGEEVVGQVELTVANALEETTNTWQGQITNLPKYDSNGNEIQYTLEELNVNKFYTSTVEGLTITNTFTVPEETKALTVNKVWVDTEAQRVHRPENVTIVAKRGDEVIGQVELTVANALEENTNTWQGQIVNLPKYDENGNEIEYALEELNVNKFYTSTVEGLTITNTFKVPDEKAELTITKVWNDNNNMLNKRPGEVWIIIKRGEIQEQTLFLSIWDALEENSNIWQKTINELPKYDENGNEIEYTLEEIKDSAVGDTEVYTTTIEGMTVTNTLNVLLETKDIIVNKVWVDTEAQRVHRPEKINIQVLKDTQVIQEKEMPNTQTSVTFYDLQKYNEDFTEIEYTIRETQVNENDLKFYESTVEGTTITNTFTVPEETKTLTVSKVWVDTEVQQSHRPESVTIVAKSGEKVVSQVELTVANALEENTNTWQGQIVNLPKYDSNGNEIEYTLEELNVNKFYTSTVEGLTITNTFTVPNETVNMNVRKVWEDSNNIVRKRPTSVIIVAKSGEEEIGQVELTASNALEESNNIWEGEIINLPKYDSNGNEITYSIDEKEVNVGDLQLYTKTIQGNTVTNTLGNARYKVEHYRRNLDEEVEGYDYEEEYFETYIGAFVTAVPKEYEGFVENVSHPNRIPSGTVTADGTLVLRLYYDRIAYNISYELNGGTETRRLARTYTYGREMYLSKKVSKVGYSFAGWYDNSEFKGNPIIKIEIGETGNKTFYAKWVESVISSDKYIIDEENGYISQVSPNTTVKQFLKNININTKVYDLQGKEVSENALIGTGYTIKVEKEGKAYTYQVAVRGDLDGNGRISVTDLSMMNQIIVYKKNLSDIQKLAADLDTSEKISITDLSMMNQYLVGKINL